MRGEGWIQPGTDINICIPFSDTPCQTTGKIVWCHPGEKGRYLMGIEFAESVNQSSIEEIVLIERFREKQCETHGIRMTSETAARELGAFE